MLVNYKPWSVKKEDLEQWGVEILEGTFKGIVVVINNITMEGATDQDVVLDYSIIRESKEEDPSKYESEEFNLVMSSIITDILKKAIDDYENRNSNSAESGQ